MTDTTYKRVWGISLLLIVLILAIALNLPAPLIASADPVVRYAAPTAQGSGNCSSWGNACTLQTALSDAASGDEIWVQAGVHYPTTVSNDRTATFTLKTGVALYGGFAGTETSLDQRDWQSNLTILSGDIDTNDTNNIAETAGDIQGDNAYHVVTGDGTEGTAVLDGFVITAGQANGVGLKNRLGGGMHNNNGSPTLRHVNFSGNFADDHGGGMYGNNSSSPTLMGVTFSGNSAGLGGGMYGNNSSSPTLMGVTFSGNSAGLGGGMYSVNSSNPTLTDVTFSGNSAQAGGGMYNAGGDSSPTLMGVTFSGNSANNGGGMWNNYSSSTLTNVSFSGNSVGIEGGGMYNERDSSPTLTNVIMWGDSAPSGSEIFNGENSTTIIAYSNIQGCGGSVSGWDTGCGTDNGNNIDADPLFLDAENGNLRLYPTSPVIDAGDNAAVPSGITTDLDGNERFVDILTIPDTGNGTPPIVDMGAYEAYKIIYATLTAQGSGNCTSWVDACPLRTALSSVVRGQEIWVQAGVYYPTTTNDRTATFTLENNVALYGGFAGTETSLDQRDWQSNLTILSGDIDTNDTNIDGNNIAETAGDIQGDNAYHVVTGDGTDSTAVLDGFVITAGQANGADPENRGGGMVNDSGNPTLRNVTFSGNLAAVDGGGMYNTNGSPTLTDVTFSGNSANYGGGMRNNYSSPTLTDVTFSGNSADYYGGGMRNNYSSPTLTEVTFSGNLADYEGGGMANYHDSKPTLTNVIFSGNSAVSGNPDFGKGAGMYNENSSPTLTDVTFSDNSANYGGGIYNFKNSSPTLTKVIFNNNTAKAGGGMTNFESCSPTLTDVTFSGNSATEFFGGGLTNHSNSDPLLINVTFSGNEAIEYGGGMANYINSDPTLTNVTFSNNSAVTSGGGMYNARSSRPTLTNVIMWGDSAPSESEIFNNEESSTSIAYSDIQGCGGSGSWSSACGTDNGNNIDADPLFVDAENGNLRLQPTSPAIDAGDNEAVPDGITTDLDGNPRFVDILAIPDTGNGMAPIVDMGAYEAMYYYIFPLFYR